MQKRLSLCAGVWVLYQQKGWDGWGHLQSDMHTVAARVGYERAMVRTSWATARQLTAWTGLETPRSPCRGLVSGKEGWLGSKRVYDN